MTEEERKRLQQQNQNTASETAQGTSETANGNQTVPTTANTAQPAQQSKPQSGFQYGSFDYGGYTESDAVKTADSALKQHLSAKPGAYRNAWQTELDNIMGQIMGREPFSYDINEDALYQQYKDQYTALGKLAMEDTMGQAAAMTGGYGSSYASAAGNQAYQSYLSQLNSVVPELYGMALDRYNAEGQELYNQYGMLADRESRDYSRYLDEYNQWVSERDSLYGMYQDERSLDYGMYQDDRNFAYGAYSDDRNLAYQQYRNQIGDEQWNKSFESGEKQQSYSNLASLISSTGYEPTESELKAAGMSAEVAAAYKKYYDDATASTSATVKYTGGGELDGDEVPRELAHVAGLTTTNKNFFDEQGNFKKAQFLRADDDYLVYRIDGKEVKVNANVNPYTGSVNPDTKNGAFKVGDTEGYQPNNIAGEKLTKTGWIDVVNGVEVTVWQTPSDGKMWVWDGTQNKYIKYDEDEDDKTDSSDTAGDTESGIQPAGDNKPPQSAPTQDNIPANNTKDLNDMQTTPTNGTQDSSGPVTYEEIKKTNPGVITEAAFNSAPKNSQLRKMFATYQDYLNALSKLTLK